jgi:hypothetical protein
MIKNLNRNNFLIALIFLSFLFITEANAQARRGHHELVRKRNVRVEHLPPHYETIVVHKNNYYYNKGFFYRRDPRGFTIVTAPVGARIRVLPGGYSTVKFGRFSYYYLNGAYYRYLPAERIFVVVENPGNENNQSNFDRVKLYDGSVVEGIFKSGSDSTISIKVNGEIKEIPINNIISITFAQSIPENN